MSKLYLEKPWLNKDWLIQKHYIEGLSIKEIAQQHNTTSQVISWNMKKFNLKVDATLSYCNTSGRKYNCNQYFFETIDTEEKAYWLGFIVADGNIEPRKDRANTFRLNIKLSSTDIEHLEKFNKSIDGNFPIKINKSKTVFDNRCIRSESAHLRVNSSVMCRSLIKLNVNPQKSCNEHFPELPDHLISHFIRGFFDGDGCFSWRFTNNRILPSCSFNLCGSYEMLFQCIQYIIKNTNIKMPKIRERSQGFYIVDIGGNFQVQKVMNFLYKDATIFLDRKYKKYNEFVQEINNSKYDDYKRKSNVYS